MDNIDNNSSPSLQDGDKGLLLFPQILHDLLDDAEANHDTDVVSWRPNGRCFRVHKRDEFMARILPRYFRQTQYKSFVRQLNIWGFSCIGQGPEKGSYFHMMFAKGQRYLCDGMVREKIKGTGSSKKPKPQKKHQKEEESYLKNVNPKNDDEPVNHRQVSYVHNSTQNYVRNLPAELPSILNEAGHSMVVPGISHELRRDVSSTEHQHLPRRDFQQEGTYPLSATATIQPISGETNHQNRKDEDWFSTFERNFEPDTGSTSSDWAAPPSFHPNVSSWAHSSSSDLYDLLEPRPIRPQVSREMKAADDQEGKTWKKNNTASISTTQGERNAYHSSHFYFPAEPDEGMRSEEI